MAQTETAIAMLESVTAKTKNLPPIIKSERPKRECRSRKRPYDVEQYTTKRLKYDQIDVGEPYENSCTFGLTLSDTDDENDTESKCSTSDETEQSSIKQFDDNSDLEEVDEEGTNVYFSKASSDQHRHIPVVFNETILQQQQSLSRYSKRLMSQFKYLYDQGLRKSIQPTSCSDDSSKHMSEIHLEKLRWELRNTFNRIDLFKEGYCVLSNEPFPFYSLCYMCGSMGSDLIHCSCCCEAYHPSCLNTYERPRLNSQSDSWLCPNCNVCNVCGLLTHRNFLSRMTNEPNSSSQLISCFDCRRNFHVKCIKKFKDDQLNEFNSLNTNVITNSAVSLSRLSNSYLINQTWFCPSCIKCDCGQALISNDRNILSVTKTFLSQQSLMCYDCLNNIKLIRTQKNENIEKCHLCEKYIEQIFFKQQHKQFNQFLQCFKCKSRFHPKCDGYLSEDAEIIPHIKSLCLNIMCSKCDTDEKEKIRKHLMDYKLQSMETIISSLLSVLQMIITDDNRLTKIQSSITCLQELHESRNQSLHLHIFLNDLLLMIRRYLPPGEIYRWQSAIDGCVIRQCPWFKSTAFLSNNKTSSNHSTPTIVNPNFQALPSNDHTYALISERSVNGKSQNSLLHYLDKNQSNEDNQFNNIHESDRRKCQICEGLSDHAVSHIGRLISFGIDQWVHVGCILPAYAKNLDQPPYILRNIRETVIRCQTKYTCAICSKLGASVHCNENECYQRFHCQCIQKYYSGVDKQILDQLNIKNGYLPNLTTLCLRHNGLKTLTQAQRSSIDGLNEDELKEFSNNVNVNASKFKCVNTSSTVYGDLSNNLVEFALYNTRLCIGSLQVESLGNFDYQIDKTNETFVPYENYPNNYRASRLFWSTTNPRQKTVYHLCIRIEQTYHNDSKNHQTIAHPMTPEQIQIEQLYDACRKYFEKLQKQIDEHANYIEDFCQKTSVNKKPTAAQTTYRKRTINAGGGLTKRLTKETPSCVKRQTPKAALKNVSRPRNRFASNKKSQISLTEQQNASKENLLQTNDIQNLFNDELLKSANVSQFALALVQALRQVGQSAKIQQQEPSLNFNLLNPINNASNGVTSEKSNDTLLKQLLKNITAPQSLNESQMSSTNASTMPSYPAQWRSSTFTQTETTHSSKSYDDFSQHSYSSLNGTTIPLMHTTDNSSILPPKSSVIPQIDGTIDVDDDIRISSTVINWLVEQVTDAMNFAECCTDSEQSIEPSSCINSPSSIESDLISLKIRCQQSNDTQRKIPVLSDDLVQLYKQWAKANFSRVQFTITNDEGYEIVSDDLDAAWSTVIELIRSCRDDMNLKHLPMTNGELNGHNMFGLTKPIVQVMLNQMYGNSQHQPTGPILLPLSSSSFSSNAPSADHLIKKKNLSSCARANSYDRKFRERQRFGWLLNQSRKIEYALKSFEIDSALAFSRRIILEEASVSLRLYHLHYFSERALLVGTSPIHGCGLFTLVDLIEGQMIIEYTGEVVRPCLTDKRERENEGKGFGCYMFTVDSMNVIDATHRGNKARFINHNCEPNCFAKTVLSGGVKHIVIYALMDIPRGSELTYDYSFPEEDIKIPCHCGTSKCRIYLN